MKTLAQYKRYCYTNLVNVDCYSKQARPNKDYDIHFFVILYLVFIFCENPCLNTHFTY